MTNNELKSKRLAKGLTQKELGMLAGYGPNETAARVSISRYEAGTVKIPRYRVESLLRALK